MGFTNTMQSNKEFKADAFYPHSTDLMKSQKTNSYRLQQIVTTRQNSIMVLGPEWGHLRESKPFWVRILLGKCHLILHYSITEMEPRYRLRFVVKNGGEKTILVQFIPWIELACRFLNVSWKHSPSLGTIFYTDIPLAFIYALFKKIFRSIYYCKYESDHKKKVLSLILHGFFYNALFNGGVYKATRQTLCMKF